MSARPVLIVQGGQYGSEAKGAIAAHICQTERVDFAVRTGATNAGHTCEYKGTRYVVQQVPVAWINPGIRLVLGAGAIIDPVILHNECEMINKAIGGGTDVRKRLIIDPRAYMHSAEYASRSKLSGRHHAIGATGKGCSEAVMDRVRLRGVSSQIVRESANITTNYIVTDTEKVLNRGIDDGARVMLEGCQGTLLDLMLGPYPYVTHKQTTPANWMSECGLSPALPVDIVMVVRTYPIRVAGNSGPMPHETSWPLLARDINRKREEGGLGPIVSEHALVQFERAVQGKMAWGGLPGPVDSDGLDQHTWRAEDRYRYREALSEVHRMALEALPADTVCELRKLFEMTTVTKKLRRIAKPDVGTLKTAARQVRPTSVAVTFMNYVFPERWGGNDLVTDEEAGWLIENVAQPCCAKVTMINRGPGADEIVKVDT